MARCVVNRHASLSKSQSDGPDSHSTADRQGVQRCGGLSGLSPAGYALPCQEAHR